jgi:hypothetical protein
VIKTFKPFAPKNKGKKLALIKIIEAEVENGFRQHPSAGTVAKKAAATAASAAWDVMKTKSQNPNQRVDAIKKIAWNVAQSNYSLSIAPSFNFANTYNLIRHIQ